MKPELVIALDYDETFTRDRELWTLFVYTAQQRGHSVAFVTFRFEAGNNLDIEADAKKIGVPVIFANGKQKSAVFTADIWIDDSPVCIPSLDALRAMHIGCEKFGG